MRALSRIGVETAYWLFSSTKMTGRSQMAARLSDSCNIPLADEPSLQKATTTS